MIRAARVSAGTGFTRFLGAGARYILGFGRDAHVRARDFTCITRDRGIIPNPAHNCGINPAGKLPRNALGKTVQCEGHTLVYVLNYFCY